VPNLSSENGLNERGAEHSTVSIPESSFLGSQIEKSPLQSEFDHSLCICLLRFRRHHAEMTHLAESEPSELVAELFPERSVD
jgi:hypothetical protein